jgi:hypothetical protein
LLLVLGAENSSKPGQPALVAGFGGWPLTPAI